MKRLPRTVQRFVTGAVLFGGFMFMASVFVPDWSEAQTIGPLTPGAVDVEPSTDPHEALASLGTIEDDCYLVKVYATPDGPLYSVYDRTDGSELAILRTAEDIAGWFPDLPIPDMDFGDGGALMLADPPVPANLDG